MKNSSIAKTSIVFSALLAALGVMALSGAIGNSAVSILDAHNIPIILQIRLPRVLLSFLAGGALAVSGAAAQSILRNPLASPYTIGVSSGASLGAGLIIITGAALPFAAQFTLPLAGFAGGLVTVIFVLVFAQKADRGMSNNTIILLGMVLSLFINAILTTISALFTEELKRITLWQMGSFALKGWSSVQLLVPFCVIGFVGVMRYARELDILTFGEDEARALGVETHKVKRRLFLSIAVLSGSAVSLSGVIGFVDLIAPHVARRLVGAQHCYVIPLSFFIGGSLMTASDLVARTIVSPSELPVGAITALIGAPFFVYVYFGKRGK
ncbi:MAG: iron ABC transporter permease [Treponemataceae bacterium]|nr:MAG: iron ABC transporter permease [Treponemataceae bacterium]